MKCEEANSLLEALCDGGLNSPLRIQVEKHAAACSACAINLKQLRALSGLLQKSVVPPPSPVLDQKLMQAFHQHYDEPVKTVSWRRRIFGGSISIPTPALAAAVILIAIALAASNMIGRKTAGVSESAANPPAPANVTLTPEIIEKTRIVEIPVVRERVVTRVVYVERESAQKRKARNLPPISKRSETSQLAQKRSQRENRFDMSGAIAENGYFTQVNLTGFQPNADMKVRIIKEVKPDEK
jgi:hypothetical protein